MKTKDKMIPIEQFLVENLGRNTSVRNLFSFAKCILEQESSGEKFDLPKVSNLFFLSSKTKH